MAARSRRRRLLVPLIFLTVVGLICLTLLEYGLRAYKSLGYDGMLWLRTSSVNNVSHPEYGWISPPDRQIDKADPCYGSGTVSYNSIGFRAPPLTDAAAAGLVVCVLGDSTMQGYQIADGRHLPHLLATALGTDGRKPYVLPLAVGGYGSTQQWMLYRDYCKPLNPDIIVQHWARNDIVNNSYDAERYGGPSNNNARTRPYLQEDGSIALRAPYPLSISRWIDDLMLIRAANSVLLKLGVRTPDELEPARERGWAVAKTMAERLAAEPGRKIALVDARHERAVQLYRDAGWELAVHDAIPPELTCAPRDPHPKSEGHRLMLDALLPVVVGPIAPR